MDLLKRAVTQKPVLAFLMNRIKKVANIFVE